MSPHSNIGTCDRGTSPDFVSARVWPWPSAAETMARVNWGRNLRLHCVFGLGKGCGWCAQKCRRGNEQKLTGTLQPLLASIDVGARPEEVGWDWAREVGRDSEKVRPLLHGGDLSRCRCGSCSAGSSDLWMLNFLQLRGSERLNRRSGGQHGRALRAEWTQVLVSREEPRKNDNMPEKRIQTTAKGVHDMIH